MHQKPKPIPRPGGKSCVLIKKWPLLGVACVSLMTIPENSFANVVKMEYSKQDELTIKGKVVDSNKSAIAGVSLQVKGTQISTSTDALGNFTLRVPKNSILVISSVGYNTQEKLIQDSNVLNIVLESKDQELDEVVVIGYGTQSRKETTGSLTSVKGEDVSKLPVQSFDASLAGRSSGVQVTSSAGVLNQAPVFKIRGSNSLSLSTYPLVVVDGIPAFENSDNSGPSYAASNPLSAINPADIESIDIAKDAAATSIYGSRAANGVVFITTKKGKQGAAKVNYDGWFGVTKANRLPKLLNAEQYVEIKNESLMNDGSYNPISNYYSLNYDNNGNAIDTKWYDYIYQTGKSHNHNVNISGATDKTNYYGSVSYTNQEGIFQANTFERKSAMFNIDNKTASWLRLGLKLNYGNETNLTAMATGSGSTGGFQSSSSAGAMSRLALINSPIVGPYNNDGTLNYTSNGFLGLMDNASHLNQSRLGFYNPILSLENNYSNNYANNVQSNVYAQINPVEWLTFKSVYGIDGRYVTFENYFSPLSGEGIGNNGSASSVNMKRDRWVWTNTLTLNKTFSNNSFNLLLGQEQQRTTGNMFGLQRTSQTDPFYTNIQGGWQNVFDYNTNNSETNNYLHSIFSRLQYDYNKKYYVTANLRQDEYSALGSNNKKGTFWGVSGGWDISKESLWNESIIGKHFNLLKLRSSYGKVGNVAGLSDFGALNTYSASLYGGQAGLNYSVTGNPDLKWETSKKFDVGVDFGLFNNAITGEFAYYQSSIDGLILAVPLPPSVGIPNSTSNSILENVGEMGNKGIEFTINSSPIKKENFRWNTSFNITTNKNEVKSLANGVESIITGSNDGMNITAVGQPVGMLYIVETAGVDPATGRRIFLDGDGRKVLYQQSVAVDNGGVKYQWEYEDGARSRAITPAEDAKAYKATAPRVFGGFTNGFSFYNFDVSALITYQFGGYMLNGNRGTMRDLRFWNNSVDILDRWQNTGDHTDIPRVVNNDNVSNGNTMGISDNVSSTDFIRLKNIMVSYTLPRSVVAPLHLSNIRVYVSGQNLAMWTKYTGLDPEVTTNGNNAIRQGIDKNQAPNARTITFGLTVGF